MLINTYLQTLSFTAYFKIWFLCITVMIICMLIAILLGWIPGKERKNYPYDL